MTGPPRAHNGKTVCTGHLEEAAGSTVRRVATLAVDRVEAVSTVGIALVVKVLEGSVRVDDRAVEVVTPNGRSHDVDLRVYAIHRHDRVELDELGQDFTGVVTFYGLYPNDIGDGWVLRTPGPGSAGIA